MRIQAFAVISDSEEVLYVHSDKKECKLVAKSLKPMHTKLSGIEYELIAV